MWLVGILFAASDFRSANFSFREFAQHGEDLVGDTFAGAFFGVAVESHPGLIAAQLMSLSIGQVSDPVVCQFRDDRVLER